MDSRVVEVAIGMAFSFAVVGALSSIISELVARAIGLRSRYLLIGLRELLDDRWVGQVSLADAPRAFVAFTNRAALHQAWDAWGARAADSVPLPADGWDPWLEQVISDETLTLWASPDVLRPWAKAVSADARALAGRTPVASDEEWREWAIRAAHMGHRMSLGSATEAVLGAPILGTQGMAGQITGRQVTILKDGNARQAPADLNTGPL